MESLFTTSEPPAGVRVMNNPSWPLLTEDARMEKLRTMLFTDLHETEGGGESHHNNVHQDNTNGGIVHNNEAQRQGVSTPSEQSEVGQDLQGASSENDQRANSVCTTPSRYESQKRRDWNTFRLYLKNHRLELHQCSGSNVLEFLRYLDQFGKTKVHLPSCSFYGVPNPPNPCRCPLRQAWGSLDALIGRLRAAFEEHGGKPESNPFGARLVRLYLREVREMQAKARGVAYGKKKRKCSPPVNSTVVPLQHPASTSNLSNSSPSAENHQQDRQQQLQHQHQQHQNHQQHQQTSLLAGMQQVQQPHIQQAYEQQAPNDAMTPFDMHDYTVPPTPDPHPLNAYSPNGNPLIKPAATSMSSFRPPLSFHSFLDDLPGRRAAAAGWALGTLYSQ
ncbi:unnamed protein product [Calypogeia fissa]